jgi:hypothetical protein
MYSDTIVNEIHQFRAQLLEQHQGNFSAYFAALLQKQQQHPERYATFMQPVSAQHQSPTAPISKTPG